MNDALKDIMTVALGIISVAILYVLVSNQGTGTVIQTATAGFAQDLRAAMGGA